MVEVKGALLMRAVTKKRKEINKRTEHGFAYFSS